MIDLNRFHRGSHLQDKETTGTVSAQAPGLQAESQGCGTKVQQNNDAGSRPWDYPQEDLRKQI